MAIHPDFKMTLMGVVLTVIVPSCLGVGVEDVVLNIQQLENMELHFISDFTSPEMNRLTYCFYKITYFTLLGLFQN